MALLVSRIEVRIGIERAGGRNTQVVDTRFFRRFNSLGTQVLTTRVTKWSQRCLTYKQCITSWPGKYHGRKSSCSKSIMSLDTVLLFQCLKPQNAVPAHSDKSSTLWQISSNNYSPGRRVSSSKLNIQSTKKIPDLYPQGMPTYVPLSSIGLSLVISA